MGWGVDVLTLGATSGVVVATPAASATAATASVAATATSAATAAATVAAASASSVFLPCTAVAASLCLAALSWKVIDVFANGCKTVRVVTHIFNIPNFTSCF